MDAAQAKRNRLPFKPPRRQSAGTNNSSSTSKTTSKAASRKTSSTSIPSKSTTSKSTTSKGKVAQRPSSITKATSSTTSNSRKRKAQSISSVSEDSETASSNDNGNESTRSRSNSPFQEPDYILAEIITNDRPRNIESDEPGIPPKLLTTILHHHFQNSKTKITKDANEVVAKYMDIFVREALARAAYERADAANGDRGGGRPGADGFLEVEDLEKLAPQMLLDF
ncbi:conserved hypothetical protein [Talaromyces stipitatus ATCC 10500]|uniref:Centromere protein X n=1 Tax=Talaromyces stipitatus (strain ATCC 10500 / CBS 375.48 / QM 6759 / NRRL 1006) TaxID=441959 RepID=B8M3E1_TALSN|nr:uncharacterized protein TSTA_095620 [Talaromyces stipitatus ATCC 10500]EED22313.1 conserved hypothetical protein [Talaromyces stipitatus ATCC 10500]